jgi:phenylpropionate dioxygenase-like ring-hydroxylating dioxygenase large terminal subunit
MGLAGSFKASIDPVALDAWYPVWADSELPSAATRHTVLLETELQIARRPDGNIAIRALECGVDLPVIRRFGYLWTSLGHPTRNLFQIPEFDEPDRRNLAAGSIGVRASAPRAVENFLDLGHLPIVHVNYLGVEQKAEIKPYDIQITEADGEVLARNCRVYQPQASLVATAGFEVEYTYRVPHPYCAILYKSSAIDEARSDVIAILVQPVDQDRSVAHMMVSVLDDQSSDKAIRAFQQFIFGQDKPILENQVPTRLPLDPRAEIPARVDATSSMYRRWLRAQGVRYGTVP